MNPMQVNFGIVSRKDSGITKKVVISRGDATKLDLKLPERDTRGFKAELRTIQPGERYELEVTLVPPYPKDRIVENLSLDTGFPEAPTASVRVYANIRPHLAARPAYFSVPQKRDKEWEQHVRLEWDDDAPHKVLSATATDPKLEVKVLEDNGRQLVVLHVPEDYTVAPRGPTVTITTDDTEVPVLNVPVQVARTPWQGRTMGTPPTRVGGAKVTGQKPNAQKPVITRPNPVKTQSVKPAGSKSETAKPATPKPDKPD